MLENHSCKVWLFCEMLLDSLTGTAQHLYYPNGQPQLMQLSLMSVPTHPDNRCDACSFCFIAPSKNHKTKHLHFFTVLGLWQIVWFRVGSNCMGNVSEESSSLCKLRNCHGPGGVSMSGANNQNPWVPPHAGKGDSWEYTVSVHTEWQNPPHLCPLLKILAGANLFGMRAFFWNKCHSQFLQFW